MYQPLIACAGCRRHVRASDAGCPFCSHDNGGGTPASPTTIGRMSRAAIVMALTLTGCPSEPSATIARDPVNVTPTPPEDAGLVDDLGAPGTEYGAPAPPPPKPTSSTPLGAPMYGAPPPRVK